MTEGLDRQGKPLGDAWILDIERGNWRKVRLNFTLYVVIINPWFACVCMCVCVCVCVCVFVPTLAASVSVFFSQPTILTGFSYAFLRFY